MHEQQKVLKGNNKSATDCSIDAMQHKQQGNHYTQGQRRDRTQEPHSHSGQRCATYKRNSDKNMRSGDKCGRCGSNQYS